jgi:hypothetical protein
MFPQHLFRIYHAVEMGVGLLVKGLHAYKTTEQRSSD